MLLHHRCQKFINSACHWLVVVKGFEPFTSFLDSVAHIMRKSEMKVNGVLRSEDDVIIVYNKMFQAFLL
jgi:hypothetical protein